MRDFGGLGGLESLFGGGRGRQDHRRGQDVRVTLKLGLSDVATGVKKSVRLKTLERCTTLRRERGQGRDQGHHLHHLRRIRRGTPRRPEHVRPVRVGVALSDLRRRGDVIASPCDVCRGEGRVRGERTVSVDIPAGVAPNNYLTLRGQGAVGPRNGPSGDLLVMLDIKEDERFERQGDDLYHDFLLSFSQAALGGRRPCRRPTATRRSGFPPAPRRNAAPATGSGLPLLGQDGKGDLLIRVHVWTPERLTAEQERLFQELAQTEGSRPSARPASGPSSRKRWAHDLVGHRRADHAVPPGMAQRLAGGAHRPGGRGAGRWHAGDVRARRGRGRRADRRAGRGGGAPVVAERRPLEAVDWTTRWRDGLGARRFGRLVVVPSWVANRATRRRRRWSWIPRPRSAAGSTAPPARR